MNGNQRRQPRPIYRIENKGGRWTLVTPDGRPFFSIGVVHIGALVELRGAINNLRAWGFNTAGYRHPPDIREQIPFIADSQIAQVASFFDKPRYPDVFGGYGGGVRYLVRAMCAGVRSNPNLIGYYWTDTPRWDLDRARRLVSDDWVSAIRRNPPKYPGKRAYLAFLDEKHRGDPEGFRQAYGFSLGDKAMLDSDFSHLSLDHPIVHRDDYEFLRLIARAYYRAAGEAMEREDRKHLVFGDRYLLDDMPVEVLEEALPWIDVVSLHPHSMRFERERFDRIYRIARKPILICDHAAGVSVSAAEAARAYESYLSDALATPYVVGYHAWSYMDRFSRSRGVFIRGLAQEDGAPHVTLIEAVGRANQGAIASFKERPGRDARPHL